MEGEDNYNLLECRMEYEGWLDVMMCVLINESRKTCIMPSVIEGFHNNAEKNVSIVFIFLSECSIYKGEIQVLDTNLQRHRKHRYNI